MKALRWIALIVGVLVLIAAAVVTYVVATFDPDAYKPRIVDLVKRQTGRTLTIDGKIALAFFPKIGVTLGKVTLSEPNSAAVFARVDEAKVAVALLPLLSKQVIVDRVTLEGLGVDLVRYKDGRTNVDDLAGRTSTPPRSGPTPAPRRDSGALAVDVGGIDLENASIGWRDEADGTNVRLTGLRLKTGRLASGVPGKLDLDGRLQGSSPKADLRLRVETGYRIDFESQAVALSGLDVKIAGDAQNVSGLDARIKGETVDVDPKAARVTLSRVEVAAKTKDGLDAKAVIPRLALAPDRVESQAISADVALTAPARSVAAKLQVAPSTATGKRVELPRVDVDLSVKQPDLSVQGKIGMPLTIDLDKQQAQVAGLAGDLALDGKNIPANAKATVRGSLLADWRAESANADLVLKVEESNITAKATVAHWSHPAVTFVLVADRLDVDRYFPPTKTAAASGGSAKSGAPASGAPPEQPFDLSPLKTLEATGNVKIGALQIHNVKATQVALVIKAAGGKLDVDPIAANLYQGTLAGSASVNANDSSISTKQRLAGVSVGPLLRDAMSKDILEGRGAVNLDLSASGRTVTALEKGLAGSAAIALKEGADKGVDFAGILRVAQGLLGSKSAPTRQAE